MSILSSGSTVLLEDWIWLKKLILDKITWNFLGSVNISSKYNKLEI